MKPKLLEERGQALIVFALAAIGIFAIVGLAIDGSAKFSDRRHAQNAADTAVLAGALARVRAQEQTSPALSAADIKAAMELAALDRAESNGYDGNLVTNQVWVYSCDDIDPTSSGDCGPYNGDSKYLEVVIESHVNTYFARVIGIQQTHNTVRSIAVGGKLSGSGIPYDPNIFRGVWAGASSGCDSQDYFLWGGSNYIINGGVHSNNDMNLSSSGNTVSGISTLADDFTESGAGNSFTPALTSNTTSILPNPFATAYTFARFNTGGDIYNAALAVNRIVITSQKIDSGWLKDHCVMGGVPCLSGAVLQDGIYVTTSTEQSGFDLGDSDIHGDGGAGDFANVTFVTNQGGIKLSGSTNRFHPYIGNADATGSTSFLKGLHGILAATWGHGPNTCKDEILSTGGSYAQYGGFLYAPNGQISLNGSNETISGCVMGNTVKLNGSNSTITCDDTWFPSTGPYSIGIMQ